MPYKNFPQPPIIPISPTLRLRAYDGNWQLGLPWYQNPVVYYNSEGITDKADIPGPEYVKGMYDYFQHSNESEMYFIEVLENGIFTPIGDAALQEKNPPIVIGVDKYRGVGIGKQVMAAIITRGRGLGIKKFHGTVIYDYNIASQKLFESLGFTCVDVVGNERIYALLLED